ncbi:MAG: glutaminase, partial [Myxococcota bacterium]
MAKTTSKKSAKTKSTGRATSGNGGNGAAQAEAGSKGETVFPTAVDAREYRLFRSLDVARKGTISPLDLIEVFARVGLSDDDFRLRESTSALRSYRSTDRIDYEAFCELVRPNILLIERALQGSMIIPDFHLFCDEIRAIYDQVQENRGGEVATYIPQLARVEPEQFAVSLCTIDGQLFNLGDISVDFCVQSCCKPINYCLALEEHSDAHVHRFIGREPSG